MSWYIDMKTIRTFQVGSCSLPSFFGSREAIAWLNVLGNVSTRARLINHDLQEISKTTQMLPPNFFELKLFMHSAKTSNRIRENVYLSTIWRLCRVAKSFSIMELYPEYVRYFDSRSVSAKYRTTARLSKSVFLVVDKLSWWSCPRCIAAFYVADIHIHQIIAVTTMSSISSLCWRLTFCRQFEQICSSWPTLFLDILTCVLRQFCPIWFLGRFRHGSLRTGVHLYIWMPHVIIRCCVNSQTSRNGYPRTFTVRIRTLCIEHPPSFNMHSNPILSETDRQSSTLNSSLVFDVSNMRFSLLASISFNLVWRELFELKWLDEYFEMSVILNKRRRWFHSSRVTLLIVNMSAIWSRYLQIWFGFCLGPFFIRSNFLSSETLWVWVKHLIVGLRPEKHLDYRFIIFNHVKQSVKWVFFAFVVI